MLATFLNTTQNAPIREPYLDLDRILQGKDFHILTTNQDTQFVKIYPEEKVSEIQGDHRFFQCSQCCQDETWDAVQPVADMIAAMGEGTMVPDELIPRCPHCGAEMFPWVRGYGNFLQGKKYEEEYEKNFKIHSKEQRYKNSLHRTWSRAHDTDVYTGTVLGTDKQLERCILYLRKFRISVFAGIH